MNREQIIDKFVKDDEYRAICRQVAGSDADDLYQELVLFILEISTEKLVRLDETCLKCFFFRMAQKQYRSNNSAFFRKYRKEGIVLREHADDIIQQQQDTAIPQEVIDDTLKAVEALEWYDREILNWYAQQGSMRAVSQDIRIPLTSIQGTIKNARKEVKSKIKDYE